MYKNKTIPKFFEDKNKLLTDAFEKKRIVFNDMLTNLVETEHREDSEQIKIAKQQINEYINNAINIAFELISRQLLQSAAALLKNINTLIEIGSVSEIIELSSLKQDILKNIQLSMPLPDVFHDEDSIIYDEETVFSVGLKEEDVPVSIPLIEEAETQNELVKLLQYCNK